MKIKIYGGNRPLTEKAKKFNKTGNILLGIILLMSYALFIMLAAAMILEIQFVFGSILCIVVPPAIFFLFLRYFNGMNMSYLELKESSVVAVDYYVFSVKRKTVDVDDIGYVKIMGMWDGKIPGRSMRMYSSKYAVFYDKNGEYLFKYLIEFEEEYAWLEHLKAARKEELEIM